MRVRHTPSELLTPGVAVLLLLLTTARVAAAQPAVQAPSIHVSGYRIDLTLDPVHHSMTAQAAVTLTALKPLTIVSFELNPALHVDSAVDAAGQILSFGRDSSDTARMQVTPSIPLNAGEKLTWTVAYSGVFDPNGPLSGTGVQRLASIGDPVSYLLYPAAWFPMARHLTDRFTMKIRVHVPVGERVLGSGLVGAPRVDPNGQIVFDLAWPQSGFPGTILAGKFREPAAADAGSNVRVYLIDKPGTQEINGKDIGAIGQREYSGFTAQFGPADSHRLNIVELPDNTVPAYWAPEMAAIAGRQLNAGNSSRLLANIIAHQWWGNDVSPATLNDAWITNGMCRLAELESVKRTAGQAAFKDAILNISASALAYGGARLADVVQYPVFSPEFQAMTYDKGAMIFRMLKWQIGDAAFKQTLHDILSSPDRSISSAEVEAIAEAASHQDLGTFFTQWIDNSGAPTLQDNWTLYRLGGKDAGYRTVGEITDTLDLFRMPVDVRVETSAKTVNQRVDVAGAQSQFVINTLDAPRTISLDPDRWLLRSDLAMQVRVHILRGLQMAAGSNVAGAIQEYRRALAIDNISSLASYRLGELYFAQRNYQAAENSFRDALHGDGLPNWTEVWSDLELGKIFDASGQRDRAVNQYREAIQTGDNTGEAIDLARKYLRTPYRTVSQAAP